MAAKGPKTLGGWVVRYHGIRKAWRIQRLLMTWGLCREALGRVPTMDEVCQFARGTVSEAIMHRDAALFREVFGADARVGDMYERMRKHVLEVSPEEGFYRAPASVRVA